MHQKLSIICPGLVNRKGSILLQDNVRPYVSMSTRQKLNELGYETLDPPSYSPDLSPTYYHLFRHLTKFLGVKCFRNQDDAEIMRQEFENFPLVREMLQYQ
ncbi:SETMAR [Cordylochernes scorpioides]|uniref:SETMAR n=1 Tax=Cordylochernes scorpioides TaxID=51811 RepID=A0ABY6L2P8_9ARAC|nr:SETMAR [Cordylochernes scorpioides]